jgi:hypothetical protein
MNMSWRMKSSLLHYMKMVFSLFTAEIYQNVTEMFHFLTELPNSSWNVLCLILSEV